MKIAGILYVFPDFYTARLGQKIRCPAAGDLFRGSLEEALQKPIDLVTVSALMQEPQTPSEEDFRNTVLKERIELHAAA